MFSSPMNQRPKSDHNRRSRAMALLVIVVGLILFTPNVASAHSDLASSSPQDGATVADPVSQVELVFVNPIDFDRSSFQVVDGVGQTVLIESASIDTDGVTVTIILEDSIYQGALGVGYTIVADDSHPRSGSITFVVNAPLPTPTPTLAPEPAPVPTETSMPTSESATAPPTVAPAPDLAVEAESSSADAVETASLPSPVVAVPEVTEDSPVAPVPDLSEFLAPSSSYRRMVNAQTVARGVGYASGVVLIGGLLFFATIAGTQPVGSRRRVIQIAGALTVLSGLALIALQAGIADGGSLGALINPADWARELSGWFGAGIAARVLGGIAGVALAGAAGQLAMSGVGLTALSFPLLGHGVSRDPSWLVFPADLVHVVVVSVWTGGLLMMMLELRRRDPVSSTDMVERFSKIAGWAVAAAVVTGIVLAGTEMESLGSLFSTTYGKRLVLKVLLVAGIVGMGAVHRFQLIPALRRSGADSGSLRKMIKLGSVEIVAMGLVLVVTTLLVNAAT